MRKGGLKIKIHDQPFQVLAALLEHPGEIVTREELRQRMWPEHTFVDFDHGLNTAVNKLREALGDSAGSPRFIETVPRRGYRFLAPTERVATQLAVQEQAEPPREITLTPGKPKRRRSLFWAAALLIIVAASLAVWFRFARHSSEPPTPPLRIVPLTGYYGWETAPTFSPDGNEVAFSWNGPKQDNKDIYVKLIGTENLLRVTSNPATDWSPAWSPDGRFIAFLRRLEDEKHSLILIPALGGPERKLAEMSLAGTEFASRFLTWSADSKHLLIVERRTREEPTSLFMLTIETGEKRSVISPPTKSIGDADPALSPDGRTLAFIRSPSYDVGDLYVLALSEDLRPKGEPRRLTFDNRNTFGPAWTPGGREIVFSSTRLGIQRLWRIAVSGSAQPQLLAFFGEDGTIPAISLQKRHLAYVRGRSHRDIWQVAVPAPGDMGTLPVSFISSQFDQHNPQYSPDGKKITFTSTRSGSHEIWACDSDGSNALQLTSFGGPVTDRASWSPDGRRIAFHSRPEGQAEIYVINTEGGRPQRLTYEQADDVAPSWSHDGKWIYFGSNRTGVHQVWKIPAAGGTPVQVTKSGELLHSSRLTASYCTIPKVRGVTSLWKAPVEGGPESKVLESLFYLNFAVRQEGIYFIPETDSSAVRSLQLLSFANGTVRTIVPRETLGEGARGQGIDTLTVSPDGRSILFARWSSHGRELVLVDNFR